MAGKFELKVAKNGKFHFNLKAGNGQIILASEMYETLKSAQNGIDSVKRNAGNEKRYETKMSAKNQPYFVLKASNGEVIGKSEMYSSASAMKKGIRSVQTNGPAAATTDMTAVKK